MHDPFQFADELGPLKIIHVHEPSVGLRAILVIDNVARGPSIGGVRMAPDVSTEECFRLARAMTFKNAAADLPHGGGKAVVYGDPKMAREDKRHLLRALANALRNTEDYIFAPDMGTDEVCMAWIRDEIARVVALPREIGGIPLDEIGATGWGLRHVTEVALEYCGFQLPGARLAIQGFGAVGKHAARFLTDRGAVLVAAGDSRGTVHNPNGLGQGIVMATGRALLNAERKTFDTTVADNQTHSYQPVVSFEARPPTRDADPMPKLQGDSAEATPTPTTTTTTTETTTMTTLSSTTKPPAPQEKKTKKKIFAFVAFLFS